MGRVAFTMYDLRLTILDCRGNAAAESALFLAVLESIVCCVDLEFIE